MNRLIALPIALILGCAPAAPKTQSNATALPMPPSDETVMTVGDKAEAMPHAVTPVGATEPMRASKKLPPLVIVNTPSKTNVPLTPASK